jgi:small subunit ribosomal protein S6
MAESNDNYELMVIIDSGIGQAGIDKRLESIRKKINKYGKIFFEDIWGERVLAYPMQGNEKGHYAVIDFSYEREHLKTFETGLRLEPEVIRHLIIRLPLKYEPKSREELEAVHKAAAAAAEAEAEAIAEAKKVERSASK